MMVKDRSTVKTEDKEKQGMVGTLTEMSAYRGFICKGRATDTLTTCEQDFAPLLLHPYQPFQ